MRRDPLLCTLLLLFTFTACDSAARRADCEERQMIVSLEKAGSDLTKPHRIEFTLHLFSETAANEVKTKLRERGFEEVEVEMVRPNEKWVCSVMKMMKPELEEIRKTGKVLEAVAKEVGGQYVSWGTRKLQ
jgi:hypothetical protein